MPKKKKKEFLLYFKNSWRVNFLFLVRCENTHLTCFQFFMNGQKTTVLNSAYVSHLIKIKALFETNNVIFFVQIIIRWKKKSNKKQPQQPTFIPQQRGAWLQLVMFCKLSKQGQSFYGYKIKSPRHQLKNHFSGWKKNTIIIKKKHHFNELVVILTI